MRRTPDEVEEVHLGHEVNLRDIEVRERCRNSVECTPVEILKKPVALVGGGLTEREDDPNCGDV